MKKKKQKTQDKMNTIVSEEEEAEDTGQNEYDSE